MGKSMKRALVCGAGGFIGHHLVKRYKKEGYWVRGVDIKKPQFEESLADEFLVADLREQKSAELAVSVAFDEVCQLAANMGGIGFISSSNDAEIMHDSALINLQVLEACKTAHVKKMLYTSSACIYPERNQMDPSHSACPEDSAYPSQPDTEYGWEKLFSERLYQAYARDYDLDIRIVRLHNIFGPLGTWQGGREKAPAALCRKIAEVKEGGSVEIWGKGDQTRSFLHIDECIEGMLRIMAAPKGVPILNLGSEENITINDLAHLIAKAAKKNVTIRNIAGPEGVRGRNSNNDLIQSTLHWMPKQSLFEGIQKLYPWIEQQVLKTQKAAL
jgi:nucleoside-diphosphate-sugar epimerase